MTELQLRSPRVVACICITAEPVNTYYPALNIAASGLSNLLHPGFDIEMDRANAIRLLGALVAAGMNTRSPKANAWIEKKASEIGLEGNQFVSAFAYAGNEGWLADAPRMGWTSLTSAGEAIAKRYRRPVDPLPGMMVASPVHTGPGARICCYGE